MTKKARRRPSHGFSLGTVQQPKSEISQLEHQALLLTQTGRLQEAEATYRKIISTGACNHVAYARLGAICGMQGKYEELTELIQKSITLKPDYPEAYYYLAKALHEQGKISSSIDSYRKTLELNHNHIGARLNLGAALQAEGNTQAAINCYKEALSLSPASSDIHFNIGVLYQQLGETSVAILSYRKAVEIKPDFAEAHNNLGNSLFQCGDLDSAIASFGEALRLRNDFPEAYNNLGNAHKKKGKLEAAIRCYMRALELKPDYPDAYYNLGIAFKQKGNLLAAIDSHKKALALQPDFPAAHNSLGVALHETGELDAAIKSYTEATSLQPKYIEAWNNLGIAFKDQGNLQRAIDSYGKALQVDPDCPDSHANLSHILLQAGMYGEGWREYEWRLQRSKYSPLHATPKCEQWRQSALPGKGDNILIVSEQGYGDTLQFMRYIPYLESSGVRLSFCAQPKLHPLITSSNIASSVIAPDQASQVTEGYWMPLLSLPGYLGVSPENPIVTQPYIKTTDELRLKWKAILSNEDRPIIGINWQGNPNHEQGDSVGRSLPLAYFEPIADIPFISLLSLQKGYGEEQLDACSFKYRFVECQEKVTVTWEFIETAAIIANCDLIITSDTSVAHLAAGMGKKTWLLLKRVPEWRWGLSTDTSFWYPSIKLFRQEQAGDWSELISRVKHALIEEFKI